MNSYFITGTDTGVGKTFVTALLLGEFLRLGRQAIAIKPIACGADGRRDAEQYAAQINHLQPFEAHNPCYLRLPLAPYVAARRERRKIPVRFLVQHCRVGGAIHEVALIEGAGGLMVPITRNYFMADFARDIGFPLIIVARLGLGTINHTLLTVRQAQASGLKVAGIVLNDTTGRRGLAERTNIKVLPNLCGAPVLGVVPYGCRQGDVAVRTIVARL